SLRRRSTQVSFPKPRHICIALHFIMAMPDRVVEAVAEWVMKRVSGSHFVAPSLSFRRGSGVEPRKSNRYAESELYQYWRITRSINWLTPQFRQSGIRTGAWAGTAGVPAFTLLLVVCPHVRNSLSLSVGCRSSNCA